MVLGMESKEENYGKLKSHPSADGWLEFALLMA
jgi:hypothetical protein